MMNDACADTSYRIVERLRLADFGGHQPIASVGASTSRAISGPTVWSISPRSAPDPTAQVDRASKTCRR